MIAGPGSGKTYSIVLRALNLLLLEKSAAQAARALCTFTAESCLRDARPPRRRGAQGGLHEAISRSWRFPRFTASATACSRGIVITDRAGPQLRHPRRADAAPPHLRALRQRSFGRRRTTASSVKWKNPLDGHRRERARYFDKITGGTRRRQEQLAASTDPFLRGDRQTRISRYERALSSTPTALTSPICNGSSYDLLARPQ